MPVKTCARQIRAEIAILVLGQILQSNILLSVAQLAANGFGDTSSVDSSQSADTGPKLSIQVRRNPALPKWCKVQDEPIRGAWHTLSDDEYSNESPHLRCALQHTLTPQKPTLRQSVRTSKELLPTFFNLARLLRV